MEWTHETSLRAIEEFRKREILWNMRNPFHYDKPKREGTWKEMAKACARSITAVKKKMDSLKGSYRREKSRVNRSRQTAEVPNDIYESKWFAYKKLQFLDINDSLRGTLELNSFDETSEEPRSSIKREILVTSSDKKNQFKNDKIVKDVQKSQTSCAKKELSITQKTDVKCLRKRRMERRKADENRRIARAFRFLLQKTAGFKRQRDECNLFSDYVADKLRKLDNQSRAVAELKISKVLFEIENSVNQGAETFAKFQPSYEDSYPVIHNSFSQHATETFRQSEREPHSMTLQPNVNAQSPYSLVSYDSRSCPSPLDDKSIVFNEFRHLSNTIN